MRFAPVLVILAFAMPVIAGEIVVGICCECCYQTDEFFAGYGMMPGYAAEVYRDPQTGDFHLVRFDIIEIEAEEIAVTVNNNYREIAELFVDEIAVNINQNHHEIGMETAEEIAVNINQNHYEIEEISVDEIASIIRNSYGEVVEIAMVWTSPELLGEISLDGVLPAGAHLTDETAEDPLNWELVSLFDGPHQCPVCCGETLVFERIGNWD
ncbi:hypothetical protein DRQ25_07955 [Candidatus Fermentibacteria bacterium]|nr:MAG: hypothetical protein DRQ25_07955 [Candidatus Fermentibacteria bacterium]